MPPTFSDVTCACCGAVFSVSSWVRPRRFCSRACAAKNARAHVGDMTGRNNPAYNGGLSTWQGRTIVVARDGGHMFYSRAVMAGHLGRLLGPNEIVHHINGDKTDDRIENLEVLTHAEHIEVHRGDLLAGIERRKAAA